MEEKVGPRGNLSPLKILLAINQNAMKLLLKLLGRTGDFSDVQPLLALFLGGALLAVFLAAAFQRRAKSAESSPPSLWWTLYNKLGTLLWAMLLVGFLL